MPEERPPETIQPIDVVIAWVDGNDQKLAERRSRYLKAENSIARSSVHSTRFASVNEIRYCVLSILTFAPFVRNVYIVTDGQDPQIWDDVRTYFPERIGSIRIVDHREIFDGFEQFLPTFNSISIGNMVWRIKGISPNFVYFNDDVFLIRRIQPTDWFVDDMPVLRGRWAFAPLHRMVWNHLAGIYHRLAGSGKKHSPRAYFHIGQWNSAVLLGSVARFFKNSHTPHAVGGKMVEEFFNANKNLLEKNLSFRFRNHRQFSFVSLSNHLQLLAGNAHIAPPDLVLLELDKRSGNVIDRKIKLCERDRDLKFICLQSLDMWHPEDRRKILAWIEKVMQVEPFA